MTDIPHVDPQDSALDNSPRVAGPVPEDAKALTGHASCLWNGKEFSDGASVCDNRIRYKCWDGKWVEVGQC